MIFKELHIGDKKNVGFEFPCPDCPQKGTAKGNFNKIDEIKKNKDGIIPIIANCDKGDHSFDGIVEIHETGLDVTVTFDMPPNISGLKVWAY